MSQYSAIFVLIFLSLHSHALTCHQVFKNGGYPYTESVSVLEDLTGLSHFQVRNTVEYQRRVTASLISEIHQRGENHAPFVQNLDLSIKANRNGFMKVLYEQGVLKSDPMSLALADKLVFAKTVEKVLGQRALAFHPKTDGLVEFLFREKLIDGKTGEVRASLQDLEAAFNRHFPEGFIIKPTSGWSSKGKNFFKDPQEVYQLLVRGESDLYVAQDFLKPFFSPRLNKITSGEKFIIQALLGHTEGVSIRGKEQPVLREFRVHTLWDQVVPGAIKGRWIGDRPSQKDYADVGAFVQRFLDALPLGLLRQQAWSFDVIEKSPGEYALVETNTNRGHQGHWSGAIQNPRILGAYARFLETQWGWNFKGLSGFLFRQDWANLWGFRRHSRLTREDHNEN